MKQWDVDDREGYIFSTLYQHTLKALLVRLATAEKIVEKTIYSYEVNEEMREAWRKSAGK